ncbi:RNA polymerase sigma factor [Paenibacillus sp. TRM 82003]|nr:RNA polymerase sigma factor [Paenibacillus sp. TRM 82003]
MLLSLGAKEKRSLDSAAGFARAIEPLLPSLKAYCRSVARNRWDADDLEQETLEKAFARYLQTGGMPFAKAYLYRIASNAWIDRMRRAREVSKPAEWIGWETLGRGDAVDAEEARWAAERVAALTPKQRAAVLLAEAFGLTLDETAERLGMNVGSVKSLLHRARASLRRGADEREEPTAPGAAAAAADAVLQALRAGSVSAALALADVASPQDAPAGSPCAPELEPGLAASPSRRRSTRALGAASPALAGFAATGDGACTAVVDAGGLRRVRAFRAGDAIAA